MTATIDYDKYANMDTRQLANALISAEKREQKFLAESQAKIKNMRELIRFLKSKIKESVDKPQFVPYTETAAYKIGRERESRRTPQEQEALEKEVNDLINKDYGDEL